MVTTVVCAITPELVANAAPIHAASIAFLANSISLRKKKPMVRVNIRALITHHLTYVPVF